MAYQVTYRVGVLDVRGRQRPCPNCYIQRSYPCTSCQFVLDEQDQAYQNEWSYPADVHRVQSVEVTDTKDLRQLGLEDRHLAVLLALMPYARRFGTFYTQNPF